MNAVLADISEMHPRSLTNNERGTCRYWWNDSQVTDLLWTLYLLILVKCIPGHWPTMNAVLADTSEMHPRSLTNNECGTCRYWWNDSQVTDLLWTLYLLILVKCIPGHWPTMNAVLADTSEMHPRSLTNNECGTCRYWWNDSQVTDLLWTLYFLIPVKWIPGHCRNWPHFYVRRVVGRATTRGGNPTSEWWHVQPWLLMLKMVNFHSTMIIYVVEIKPV